MLKMSGILPILCDGSPTVIEHLDLPGAEIDHWLDCECHTGLKERPATSTPEIGYLWRFVHAFTDSVTYKIPNNSVVMALDVSLDSVGDVPYPITGTGESDGIVE